MRYSKAFIPTIKEVPKEATMPSHVLLLRAGFIRMVGSGIYELLPLGLRVLTKIANVIREEMNRADAQELLLPALLPADYFRESGRWDGFGDTLLRLTDRKGGDYHLGPTHEEIITDLVRREVKSYRQLPLNLYQIQTKYRDEPRPRAGLLRGREFVMKDAYSFDPSEAAATQSYETMRDAYHRIFGRLGLDYRVVDADSGSMGGSTSAEFQILTQNGEDALAACGTCDYAANLEVASTGDLASEAGEESAKAEVPSASRVKTPGTKTIDEVVTFLGDGISASSCLKALAYAAGDAVVLAVIRGDHDLNETKLARALSVPEVRLASEAQLRKATGAEAGFIGPVGFDGRIFVDTAASRVEDAVCGANEADFHLRHVVFGRDYEGEVVDLRQVQDGDPCPKCHSPLRLYRGIEGGHIFILGTHYSERMGATFLDDGGNQKPLVMGCYGIGVSRLIAAAIEQNHDESGMRWPMAIAPFHVIICPLGKKDDAVIAASETLYSGLRERGVETLLDDRDERPGVKFKDADLLGIPIRVVVGARGLAEGKLEVKRRDAKEPEWIAVDDASARLANMIGDGGGSNPE